MILKLNFCLFLILCTCMCVNMFSFTFCNLDFVEDDGSRVAVLLLLGLFGRVNEWPAQLSVSVRVGEV